MTEKIYISEGLTKEDLRHAKEFDNFLKVCGVQVSKYIKENPAEYIIKYDRYCQENLLYHGA
ncbi:MAG TPA: hypothetical protein VMX17_01970 [Candidatus Glassbacteria bacterium]|nr:hypothetical protein [Candidatus Glassbacteria bacterium]